MQKLYNLIGHELFYCISQNSLEVNVWAIAKIGVFIGYYLVVSTLAVLPVTHYIPFPYTLEEQYLYRLKKNDPFGMNLEPGFFECIIPDKAAGQNNSQIQIHKYRCGIVD